jgi:flagellar hook-associated protein 3 FlgL
MRVTFGSIFRNGLVDINRAYEALAARQREVSSGKRISVASDDPSAMVAAMNEKAEMATLDRFQETADTVESRLTVVDTVLSDVISQITFAQTRAGAGRNSFLTAEQRTAIAGELRGTASAIVTAFNTSYRGMYVFSGGQSTTAPFAAGPPISGYQGDAAVQYLEVDRGRRVQVTFDGGAILQGSAPVDLIQTLQTLADDVQAGNMAGIDAGLVALGGAFDRATNAQTGVGLDLSRITDDRARLDRMHRSADQRRSVAEDANLAESISGMTQADTAHRAALQALANTGRLSLMDYLR